MEINLKFLIIKFKYTILFYRLLYFIILNNIKCTSSLPPNVTIQTVFIRLCSEIMNTMLLIENNDIPLFLRDLFLEQSINKIWVYFYYVTKKNI